MDSNNVYIIRFILIFCNHENSKFKFKFNLNEFSRSNLKQF